MVSRLLGRDGDALTADRKAGATDRKLHAAAPSAFRDNLINALQNIAFDLHNLHLKDETGQAERELAMLTGQSASGPQEVSKSTGHHAAS